MSNQQPASDLDDDQRRIKSQLSGSLAVARSLDFDDELAFEEFVRDEIGVADPSRRRLLRLAGAATLSGALAGCEAPTQQAAESPAPEPEPAEGTQPDIEEQSFEQEETVQIESFQWGFTPQQIEVPVNTKLTLEFVTSTFEKEPDFTVHSWYLEAPYDIGPVELHEDTDPDVDAKVEFVADQTGEFQYECTIYCGTGHANMKGTLIVTEEGAARAQVRDFTKMDDIASTHEVLMEASELTEEPPHDIDLRDLMVVTERENASVALVDTINNELVDRIEDVGKAIHVHDFHGQALENTRDGAYVYTLARSGWLYKVDLFGFNRIARVRGGTDARKPAVSRDDKYVAAGFYNPNHILIADAETMEPIKRIPTHTVNPDGQSVRSRVCALHDVAAEGVWVAALKEGGEVWLIDYTQDDFPVVDTFDVGRILHDGFFTESGRYFHIASQADNLMGVIDTKKRELVAKVPTAKVPHPGTAETQDHERDQAYVVSAGEPKVTVYDTKTWEQKKLVDVPGLGLFGVKRPDEQCRYFWGDAVLSQDHKAAATVYQMDPDSLEVVNEIDTSEFVDFEGNDTHPISRATHPEFSRDGSKVFVSLWDAGKIVVLDSETGEHLDTLHGFETPTGKFTGFRAADYGEEA